VYVQDICSILSHIISRASQAGGQSQAAVQTSSSGTSCVLAGLPHSVYNMVSTSAPASQVLLQINQIPLIRARMSRERCVAPLGTRKWLHISG